MTSSASSLFVPSDWDSSFARCRTTDLAVVFFASPRRFTCRPRSKSPRILRLSSSIAISAVDLSWFPSQPESFTEDYGGWAVAETSGKEKKKGLSPLAVGALGCAVALALASLGYSSMRGKGFRLNLGSPLHSLYGVFRGTEIEVEQTNSENSSESGYEAVAVDSSSEFNATATSEFAPSGPGFQQKHERILVPLAVDSTQQEALSMLKKLKIIQDDPNPNGLCTRREYARWLVRLNSMLERKPDCRIVPSVALSGSAVAAFDDSGVEDPDFESIQALAEAGIVPSKLCGKLMSVDGSEEQDKISFFPEGFISRQDLINWKASVEYKFGPEKIEQMLRMKVEYIDLKDSPDSSPGLFMDMLDGEQSIVRKVFGKSRRLQPTKPSTRAQAAVALTSGRMEEAIQDELLRLEGESSSRKVEMEEIRSVLLARGEIQKFWDKQIEEERAHAAEAEDLYLNIIRELEQDKIAQEKWFAESLKERAAIECQRQLLLSLQEEVDQMSERLVTERAMCVNEQRTLQDNISQLQFMREELLNTKSVLEAETEAIRILRSWVEDEARKSQARAKVLEEVGRRWRWDDEA